MLNSKIGLKLTFGVVLTLLIVISIFAYFNIQSENKTLLMEVERHATQFSEHLKSDMGYDMLHNDRVRIQDSISRIGSQGAINGIRVFNKDGEVIYSSIAEGDREDGHHAGHQLLPLPPDGPTNKETAAAGTYADLPPRSRRTTPAGDHQPGLQ